MNIVLDLDSTLICTYEGESSRSTFSKLKIYTENEDIAHRVYHFELENGSFMWGVFRPGVAEFLKWSYNFFNNVIIWSAGMRCYVKKIVHILNKSLDITNPDIVFYREHCTNINNKKIIKHLDKIFEISSLKNKNINKKNTLLIDDNKSNHKHNKENTILIPAYLPDFTIEGILIDSDRSLLILREWFESIPIPCKDITLIPKPVF